jgi:hypothetical protein
LTTALDRSSELERLLGADRLAQPLRPLGDGTSGRRDPSPTWDAWYSLSLTLRRRLLPFMAPAGHGLSPDDMADAIGASSIDQAIDAWARVCQLARRGGSGWEIVDLADWQAADRQAEADAELYGPAELAERLGITVPALYQRKTRGQLPAPDMTISKVPIWTGETLRIWAEWS